MQESENSEQITILRPGPELIPSFYAHLDAVAKEKRFIERIEAPPFDQVLSFQKKLIESGGPVSYAVLGDEVIGSCDIFPIDNPRQNHRGTLGMGLRHGYRGRGLGSKLMAHALEQAKTFGLEKVELMVFTSNTIAIRLYEKFGFEREGLIKSFRKLDGETYDGLMMAKFL